MFSAVRPFILAAAALVPHLLGKWTGPAASFKMPPSGSSLWKTAVLVQDGPGGAILSARKL